MSNYGSPFGPRGFGAQPFGSAPLDYTQASDIKIVAKFFNAVYAWMFAGLGLTALVAWYVAHNSDITQHLGRGAFLGLFIVQVVLVGVVAGAVNRINAALATVLFLLFSALNGLSLAGLFFVYTNGTLISAFLGTAVMFGAMSLWGLVTQKDLSRFGSLLFMGLIGIVAVSLINLFIASTFLSLIVSYVGVAIFVGLTAYDTQALRKVAMQTAGDQAMAARMSVVGALMLYLDFINMFIMLVQILGNNNRRR